MLYLKESKIVFLFPNCHPLGDNITAIEEAGSRRGVGRGDRKPSYVLETGSQAAHLILLMSCEVGITIIFILQMMRPLRSHGLQSEGPESGSMRP